MKHKEIIAKDGLLLKRVDVDAEGNEVVQYATKVCVPESEAGKWVDSTREEYDAYMLAKKEQEAELTRLVEEARIAEEARKAEERRIAAEQRAIEEAERAAEDINPDWDILGALSQEVGE